MRLPLLLTLLSVVTPLLATPNNDSGSGPREKKLIALGWDSPDAATYLANLKEIESTPFNGIRIQLAERVIDGNRITLRNLFSGIPWKREWFQEDIDQLKAAQSKQLTDNFLSAAGGPPVDWFDDEGWESVIEHAKIAAWIARESGMKGIMFDAEVGQAKPPFTYLRQDHKDRYSFEQYAAQARKRGREMMEALKSEYPEMTLFTLFMNSGLALGSLGGDPREGLSERRNYSLYPAFINGWLDAIGPEMTLIDGAEYSYPHSDEAQYLKHSNAVRNTTSAFIAPENLRRYRQQSELALAIYLDAFTSSPLTNVHSDVFNDPPLKPGERLVDRLEAAVSSAQYISDGYVWLWGENYRWWPTPMERVKPQKWEAILPGVSAALRRGMDPEMAMLARAKREFHTTEHKSILSGRPLKNRISNGDFSGKREDTTLPDDWTLIGSPHRDAQMGYKEEGAAKLEGGKEAQLIYQAKVLPSTFYHLRLRVRQMGNGDPSVSFTCGTNDMERWSEPISILPKHDPRDAWQVIEHTFRVPPGFSQLTLKLSGTGQKDSNDVLWYDDVELIPISVN